MRAQVFEAKAVKTMAPFLGGVFAVTIPVLAAADVDEREAGEKRARGCARLR